MRWLIFFRGTKDTKALKLGEQGARALWGTEHIGNQDFDFGEHGNSTIYFGETREQEPTWKGLKTAEVSHDTTEPTK